MKSFCYVDAFSLDSLSIVGCPMAPAGYAFPPSVGAALSEAQVAEIQRLAWVMKLSQSEAVDLFCLADAYEDRPLNDVQKDAMRKQTVAALEKECGDGRFHAEVRRVEKYLWQVATLVLWFEQLLTNGMVNDLRFWRLCLGRSGRP